MKVLVAGWFSFDRMGATAGDLMVRDIVCEWLDEAGCRYDVAVAAPFTGGIDWREADPRSYSDVVFVCGPFGNGPPLTAFLERFSAARLHGLDLSMLESLDAWNPFAQLFERDSSREARPDLAFLSSQQRVPVVGVVLVHEQKEYGGRGAHAIAHAAIERLLSRRELARVEIDTRLDVNATRLRTSREVESVIARTDLVVTTRLHGLVLALRNAVPVIAVDPVAGGAKVLRQARTLDWPLAYGADQISEDVLDRAVDFCLTEEARAKARACAAAATARLSGLKDSFLHGLTAQ